MTNNTYTSSIACFTWVTEGRDELSLRSASVKSEGNVTFDRASRLGTLICGGVMFPKGFTLLIPLIAVVLTEFAEDMYF